LQEFALFAAVREGYGSKPSVGGLLKRSEKESAGEQAIIKGTARNFIENQEARMA
jgi:hypothetical protein